MTKQVQMENRIKRTANYMLTTGATIREAAAKMGVSKSTIHRDMTLKLPMVAPDLVLKIQSLLNNNRRVGQIKGGEATKAIHNKEGDDVVDLQDAKAENF